MPATGRGQKRFHDLNVLSYATGFGGRRRPVQQAGDRFERHGQHVVQHESNALRG